MAAHSCLVLYGNSVFLAGLKATLARDATLDLIAVEDGQADMIDLIRDYRPRAILFDLTMGEPDVDVSLLWRQPDLLLIGLDPSSNELLILSRRPAQALDMADLLKVIHQMEPISETPGGKSIHSP